MSRTPDVVMLSGGIDSTALALSLVRSGEAIRGLYLDLGQASAVRQEAATKRLALQLGVPLEIGRLPGLAQLSLPWLEPPFALVFEGPGMGSVQALLVSSVFAINTGARRLYHGATIEDAMRFPEFPEAVRLVERLAMLNGTVSDFRIETPFIQKTRSETLTIVKELYPSGFTWSCHLGGAYHCGECEGCNNRKTRFASADLTDTTVYDSEGSPAGSLPAVTALSI